MRMIIYQYEGTPARPVQDMGFATIDADDECYTHYLGYRGNKRRDWNGSWEEWYAEGEGLTNFRLELT